MLIKVIQNAWSGDRRQMAKRTVKDCAECARYNEQAEQPSMSTMPNFRKDILPPFTHVLVDFAGPINYTETRLRKSIKRNGAYIFVVMCLVTRAIHLETTSSLQSKSVKHTLKAYMARRRVPTTIYSDRGSSLIKRKNQIESKAKKDIIGKWIYQHNKKLVLVPTQAHHFNGGSEAAVKLFKRHFLRAYGEESYTVLELH
jgi:hypothetical protein